LCCAAPGNDAGDLLRPRSTPLMAIRNAPLFQGYDIHRPQRHPIGSPVRKPFGAPVSQKRHTTVTSFGDHLER